MKPFAAVWLIVLSIAVLTLRATHNPNAYEAWLKKDVRWIITPEESVLWQSLSTDRERDRFIEQFWDKRNGASTSITNAFKEEHYRRLAFANTHFAASSEGDLTNRGRAYIVYGAPVSRIEETKIIRGKKFPTEQWRYFGGFPTLEFVDRCGCGEFDLESPTVWPPLPASK
jgi:GWxTD domain-containing protein